MGDNFISVVPLKIAKPETQSLAERVINWLKQKQIIQKEKTDCVLGDNMGYAPGENFKTAIDGDDCGVPEFKTNGLEIVTQREVFHNGQNGIDSVTCPNCNFNIMDSDWGELVSEWFNDTGRDKITCTTCNNIYSIVDYKFDPPWAFGDVGFTFWNWPSLTDDFIEEFKTVIGKPVTVVYGRL
jgi:hypothetical protein